MIAACRRHLSDLERDNFEYEFSEQHAERACKFIQALPHVKGKWAAGQERLVLEPWQKFIVCSLFGWVHRKTDNYRFREAYICVPRKNSKSTLGAAIGLFKFAADGEFGAEVYSGATTEKQAWEVFRPARLMVKNTPALARAFGISVNAKSLAILGNGSRFEPIIGKPGDGASPSCAIVDEFHEHLTDDLDDTMKTGMGARENPLLFRITTAGSNRSGPCYALQTDAQQILAGKVTNERLFTIIYTIDDNDDWKAEIALRKANPNFGISVSAEFLREEQQSAIQSARKQNIFKTKHLDVWVNAAVAWMNMAKWDAMADPTLKVEQFEKQDCILGLDLASSVDLCNKARLFRSIVDGKAHYYAFLTHYLNQAAVENSRGSHYWGWANEKRLEITPGAKTDHKRVMKDVIEDSKKFHILEVPHDKTQALTLTNFIQDEPDWDQTIKLVEVPQTVLHISPAMKELEALVLDGRFHHDGDPILGWAVANVICWRDLKDNIFPRKEKEENKIDPVLAILFALSRWMATPIADNTSFEFEAW